MYDYSEYGPAQRESWGRRLFLVLITVLLGVLLTVTLAMADGESIGRAVSSAAPEVEAVKSALLGEDVRPLPTPRSHFVAASDSVAPPTATPGNGPKPGQQADGKSNALAPSGGVRNAGTTPAAPAPGATSSSKTAPAAPASDKEKEKGKQERAQVETEKEKEKRDGKADNHGQYVSGVARDTAPNPDHGKTVKEAAQSEVGKPAQSASGSGGNGKDGTAKADDGKANDGTGAQSSADKGKEQDKGQEQKSTQPAASSTTGADHGGKGNGGNGKK